MKNIRKIFTYTTGLTGYFVVIGVTAIITAVLALANPIGIKIATDWVVTIVSGETVFSLAPLLWVVGALVLLSLVSVVTQDVGGYFGDQLAVRTRRQLSNTYYRHLSKLPQHYYDNEITGKIINRLSRAITDITDFLQFFSNNLLQLLITLVITIGILFWYSWPIALLFIMLIPANLYLTAKSSVKWQAWEKEKNRHFDIASGRFAEVIGQMRLVKSFRTEERELGLLDAEMSDMVGITADQSKYWHLMNGLRGLAFVLLNGGMFGLVFYHTAKGTFTIGDMAMLLALIQQASFPVRNVSFFVDRTQRAVANSKDYIEAMGEDPEQDISTKSIKVSSGEITFNNVSFGYKGGSEVLHDINFSIPAGESVALVGESGGGKTTISNLLMRLYDADSGRIAIDGQNIGEFSRTSVRDAIATVFQDAALFSGTVRDNIAYAKPDASDAQIKAAAKAANAYDFINKLVHGFDTEIGERGIKLSGGQKQRISIARAVLKNAPILILDEATSSLDSRAEKQVQEALDALMAERTTLIIAHRLSTIASVDHIVTLKNGGIDEVGTPRQLAKSGGIYSQLLELQLGSTEKAREQLAEFDITQ